MICHLNFDTFRSEKYQRSVINDRKYDLSLIILLHCRVGHTPSFLTDLLFSLTEILCKEPETILNANEGGCVPVNACQKKKKKTADLIWLVSYSLPTCSRALRTTVIANFSPFVFVINNALSKHPNLFRSILKGCTIYFLS